MVAIKFEKKVLRRNVYIDRKKTGTLEKGAKLEYVIHFVKIER